jgi:uncharacterized membrane protein YesL
MAEAWHVVRAALRDTWGDLLTTAVVNLLWLVFTLVIVTAPPAALALFYVGHRIAHGDATDPRDFLQALGRYFRAGWRWGLIQGVVLFLLVGDVFLCGRLGGDSAAGRLAQGLYLGGLAIWLLLQLYALAFLFEQETPSMRLALRNGASMLGRNLVFSVTLGVLILLVLTVGTIVFLVTLAAGGVFVALVGNHAVLNRVAAHRAARSSGSGEPTP